MWKNEKIDFKATVLMGVFLAGLAVITFGGIAFAFLLFSGNIKQLPATVGVVSLSSCGVLALFPIVGLIASASNKSWYALKFWLVASGVAVLTCFTIAMICFQFVASSAKTSEDIWKFIPSTRPESEQGGTDQSATAVESKSE